MLFSSQLVVPGFYPYDKGAAATLKIPVSMIFSTPLEDGGTG